MSAPLVSIVIPAYNAEKYLPATLDCVLRQRYRELEVLVVDDGSRDGTASLARATGDERVRVISKPNSGVCDTRNRGLREARGEFVLFLDADDLFGPEFIGARVAALQARPECAFSYSRVLKVDSEGRPLPGEFSGPRAGQFREDVLLYRAHVVTCPSNFLIRRELLVRSGLGFNGALFSSADKYFLLQLHHEGEGAFLEGEAAWLHYRVHAQSMSNSLTDRLVGDSIRFAQEVEKLAYIGWRLRRRFRCRANFMIGASYSKLGKRSLIAPYMWRAFVASPTGLALSLSGWWLNRVASRSRAGR